MSFVFGPVPSRRLGLSLGIDLVPSKTCTFDCLYCQVGRTTSKSLETMPFVPVHEVVEEVEKKLSESIPDTITLAGSGEPTLNSEIDQIITSIKEMTQIKVALLTNGSLFWREDVRRRVLDADIIMPTLTSAFERTFRMIHRPHPDITLTLIIDGLKKLRQDYKGQVFLEVVFLAGINDTDKEMEGLRTLIDQVAPEKVHLNTVSRPPADSRATALDRKRLEEVMVFFGEKAEIVAEPTEQEGSRPEGSMVNSFLEMVKRRPLKAVDIANALSISTDAAEDLVKSLLIKGYIRKREHEGHIYYLSNEKYVN